MFDLKSFQGRNNSSLSLLSGSVVEEISSLASRNNGNCLVFNVRECVHLCLCVFSGGLDDNGKFQGEFGEKGFLLIRGIFFKQ